MFKYKWNIGLVFWIALFIGRLISDISEIGIPTIIGAFLLVILPSFLAYMAGIEYQKGKINE